MNLSFNENHVVLYTEMKKAIIFTISEHSAYTVSPEEVILDESVETYFGRLSHSGKTKPFTEGNIRLVTATNQYKEWVQGAYGHLVPQGMKTIGYSSKKLGAKEQTYKTVGDILFHYFDQIVPYVED
jgi:hypothetical protein